MPIRIKLKDEDQPLTIRVDAGEWAKAFEHAREGNGIIEVHEGGRTLAINARQIVFWETVREPGPAAEREAQLA